MTTEFKTERLTHAKRNNDLEIQIRLSAQMALLGAVPASLRAVSVDVDEQQVFFRCIFDGEPREEDWELLSCAATEIVASFSEPCPIEEEYLAIVYPTRMNHLKHLIYLCHEHQLENEFN